MKIKAQARHTDPETSKEAAASISTDKLRESQKAVLSLFYRLGSSGSMTDSELIAKYSQARFNSAAFYPMQSDSGLRTRRKELVDQGILQDSGERRRMQSGRKSIAWSLARTEEE